jgi:hypothetical protein
MNDQTQEKRSRISSQERQQIGMLLRFLVFVLMAVAIAAVVIGLIVTNFDTNALLAP